MPKFKVYAALVLVQVFFGIHYFITKLILGYVPALAWASLRVLGAAAILMAYNLLFLRRHPRSWRDVGQLCVFAVFGIVINQVLFAEGLARTTPSHSALIVSLIPVITLCIALLMGRERPTLQRLSSIVLSFASILVLLRVESFRLEEEWVIGDLLTLANCCSFSFFLVISKSYLRHNDALAATAYLMLFGSVGILTLGGGALLQVDLGALPGKFWVWAAYAVVFATALAYYLNYYALSHVDSSMVALFIYLQTPIATVLSVTYLDEKLTMRFLVAGVGIFLGVFLAVWRRREPAAVGAPAR